MLILSSIDYWKLLWYHFKAFYYFLRTLFWAFLRDKSSLMIASVFTYLWSLFPNWNNSGSIFSSMFLALLWMALCSSRASLISIFSLYTVLEPGWAFEVWPPKLWALAKVLGQYRHLNLWSSTMASIDLALNFFNIFFPLSYGKSFLIKFYLFSQDFVYESSLFDSIGGSIFKWLFASTFKASMSSLISWD